jgi:hypothetical protein
MMYEMSQLEDPCFVISVAARMIGVHAQTLRHYERVGLVWPSRSVGRQRLYSRADIERLNATLRERLAVLTRRGRALARRMLTLQHGMSLLGTVENFCTPHASLAPAGRGTTPAMAAGITDHCGTVQDLLSLHVPPPRWTPPQQRGRRSGALQRLMERWCA